MSNTKQYKVQHMDGAFEMVVEIGEDLNEILPELFETWGVKEENGEKGLADLLKKLACTVFRIASQFPMSLLDVSHAFQIGEYGWPQMDGSWGIEIVKVEYSHPEFDGFSVEEI